MSSQTKGFVGADMQLPTPHERSQLQLRRDPAAPDEIDHTSRIEKMFKDENVMDLENALKVQRQASNPNFNPRRWLSMIDQIHLVQIRSASSDETRNWRQNRTQLLLKYFEDTDVLVLLHYAIGHIKGTEQGGFTPPKDDAPAYFAVYQILQRSPELAFQSEPNEQPAFLLAASRGSFEIVSYIIDKLESKVRAVLCSKEEEIQDQIFEQLKAVDSVNNTALGLAVQHGRARIVKVLLDKERRLAQREYLRDDQIEAALKQCEIDIMHQVIAARPGLAKDLPTLIVTGGGPYCFKIWEAMAQYFEPFLDESYILHLLVKRKQEHIIGWLVHQHPQTATRRDDLQRIALSYNNDQTQYPRDNLIREKIRELIISALVRSHNPEEIQRLLLEANDTPRQTCLDLALFNPSTHDFAPFIDLVRDSTRIKSGLSQGFDAPSDIRFETVLRYVKFPDMSQEPKPKNQISDREDVSSVLLWLRRKGVKIILKLIVPDCILIPFDEDKIPMSVKGFRIEQLNWRRLDLCIGSIMGLASTLTSLHLYSSGNWAVLCHWVSEGGLAKLEKLKKLCIILVEECMTAAQAVSCYTRTENEMRKLKARCGWSWDPIVKMEAWSRGTDPIRKSKRMAEPTHYENELSASTSIGLDHFVTAYGNIQQARLENAPDVELKPFRKIKIALIDTGIVAMEDRRSLGREFLPGQIKDGISFVHGADGESESHWWLPSNEHGPQMADIICAIDPYCELYPIKVANERSVKAPQTIIDAINWAIEQDVDIISMSLVLFNAHEGLFDAIDVASNKDIVIICSTADQGNNHQKVYPAMYWKEQSVNGVIPVAACDQYGKLTDWSTETEARYYFRGKDVTAKPVRFLRDSQTKISGSSVATAVAAGTASLILACCHLALKDKRRTGRKHRVEHFFRKMRTDENIKFGVKYVEPSIIFGKSKMGESVKSYIEDTFELKTG